MEKVSVIIPCYNSSATIRHVVEDIRGELEGIYSYNIILTDDYSRDGVWNEIKKLCKENPNIVGLSLSQNFGQQSARMAALEYADGDYVAFMDDDGQHVASGITKMIGKLEEGYDIVYAHFPEKKESWFKKFGSNINRIMTDWIIGKPQDVIQTSFFVTRKYVVDELKKYESPFPYLFGYLMQITRNIANVEIEHHERISGSSGYTFCKLVRLWTNGFTSFSVIPLRIASIVGIICACIGFVWGIFTVVSKIVNPSIMAGFTTTIAVILFCSGIIMLMLGIIGEYIGRIFITINRIPQYVVRESVNTK